MFTRLLECLLYVHLEDLKQYFHRHETVRQSFRSFWVRQVSKSNCKMTLNTLRDELGLALEFSAFVVIGVMIHGSKRSLQD